MSALYNSIQMRVKSNPIHRKLDWALIDTPGVWYSVALRESDKTFKARTFICIGMRRSVTFYSTRSGIQSCLVLEDRSVSRPVPLDLLSLWYLVKYKLGRGDSHVKRTGALVVNFEKKTLRGCKVPFCGRGLKYFSTPKRFQFLNSKLTDTFIKPRYPNWMHTLLLKKCEFPV